MVAIPFFFSLVKFYVRSHQIYNFIFNRVVNHPYSQSFNFQFFYYFNMCSNCQNHPIIQAFCRCDNNGCNRWICEFCKHPHYSFTKYARVRNLSNSKTKYYCPTCEIRFLQKGLKSFPVVLLVINLLAWILFFIISDPLKSFILLASIIFTSISVISLPIILFWISKRIQTITLDMHTSGEELKKKMLSKITISIPK